MDNNFWYFPIDNLLYYFLCNIVKLIIKIKTIFKTSPTVKELCQKNSQMNASEIESKLITRSLNDKQSMNSYTL
jgi:hypothetical protein